MKIFFRSLAIILAIMLFSCQKQDDNQNNTSINFDIYIYGILDCHYCNDLENILDQNQIPYIFYDSESNNEKRAEMMAKMQAAGFPPDSIQWPVVDVMIDNISNIFIQPDYETEIKPLIKK